MAVTVPLVSALSETPSSTGPLDPLSTVAGTLMLGQSVYLAVRQRRSLNLKDCVATNLPKLLLFPAPTCSSHRREQTSRAACWQILVRRSTSGQSKKLSQTKILADSGTHCIRFTRKDDLRRWPIGQFSSQFKRRWLRSTVVIRARRGRRLDSQIVRTPME